MARLFVAVLPPADVREVLRGLDRTAGPGVRWVPESQWHVTLRFLGDCDPGTAAEALTTLRGSATPARLGPAVRRLGARVVCVPVAGLDALAAEVDEAVEAVAAPANHPFHGHVTLGRVPAGAVDPAVVGSPVSLRFVVERVALVQSRLGSGPAHHEVVAEQALAVESGGRR